jgi:hypothetical protein
MTNISPRTVDPWTYFADANGCLRADLNYQGDGQHPNEDGEMLLAGLIGSAIQRYPLVGGSVVSPPQPTATALAPTLTSIPGTPTSVPATATAVPPSNTSTPTGPWIAGRTSGGQVIVSWGNIVNPQAADWVGLFTPGSADTTEIVWSWVNCTVGATNRTVGYTNGSCSYPVPTTGNYEFRFFPNNAGTHSMTSQGFSV